MQTSLSIIREWFESPNGSGEWEAIIRSAEAMWKKEMVRSYNDGLSEGMGRYHSGLRDIQAGIRNHISQSTTPMDGESWFKNNYEL